MGIWAYGTQCNDSNAFSASLPNTIWWWSTKSTRIVAVGSVCPNAHVQYTQLSSAHLPNYTKNNIRRISYISSLTLISCISFFMSPPISRTIFFSLPASLLCYFIYLYLDWRKLTADPLHGEEKHIRIKYKNVLVIHGYSVIEILVWNTILIRFNVRIHGIASPMALQTPRLV